MKTYYDKDSDFLEVIEAGHENFAEDATQNLALFYTEESEKFIGFALHNAKSNLEDLVHVPIVFRLAGLVKMYRDSDGMTQKQLSEKTGISFRQIQNIESGETNASIAALSKIINAFPQWDFSILTKPFDESA